MSIFGGVFGFGNGLGQGYPDPHAQARWQQEALLRRQEAQRTAFYAEAQKREGASKFDRDNVIDLTENADGSFSLQKQIEDQRA